MNTLQQGGLTLFKVLVLVVIMLSIHKMADIAFPYLVPPFPTDIDFLQSKQSEVQLTSWMVAFYIHIVTSVLALAAGVTQFSKTLMYQYPKIHRTIGKIYIITILFLAAPTGLYMGFYGNGGLPAQIAFIFQAIAWWSMTYFAYERIKTGKPREHGAFMLRSYAIGMSAITLRGMSYIIYEIKEAYHLQCPDTYVLLCHPDSYIFIAWSSWIINYIVAEILILCGIMNYYFKNIPSSHAS